MSRFFFVVSLFFSGCVFDQPPTDEQIKQALYDYVRSEDRINNLMLLEQAGRDSDLTLASPSAFDSLFESAGCAKSQTSSGYVCTVKANVLFRRHKSDLWQTDGLVSFNGPIELYINKDKKQWEVVGYVAKYSY